MRSRYKRNLKRYPKMKNGILVYVLCVWNTPYVVVVGFCCYCYCYSCCYCCWSILSSISSSLDVDIFVHMNRQKSFSVLFAITQPILFILFFLFLPFHNFIHLMLFFFLCAFFIQCCFDIKKWFESMKTPYFHKIISL